MRLPPSSPHSHLGKSLIKEFSSTSKYLRWPEIGEFGFEFDGQEIQLPVFQDLCIVVEDF